MLPNTALTLLIPLLAITCANAQGPDHLVGLTRNTPSLQHRDHWNCALLNSCPVPLPSPGALSVAAGGTGWDPVRSGAWVTDGTMLTHVDDACNVNCPPMPIAGLGGNVFATGLDVVESLNQILIIDSSGRLHTLTNTCPPNTIGVCNTGLVNPGVVWMTSGLASDEGHRLVFIAVTDFNTGANQIAVMRLGNPCQQICMLPVQPPPCAVVFRSITGLACDWGRQVLYATDGRSTIAMRYSVASICPTIVTTNCCTPPVVAVDPLVGLAVRPGKATSHGQPCGNGSCPSCPMAHSLANDPNLGNASFALRLDQAPTGSLAWCLIGAQPCTAPGLLVPPLCGPIFTQPLLGTLGPNPTIGLGGCTGSTTFGFPLPPWPALAGWTLSSQCIALCTTTTGIGTAVSNCLSFTLQGN
ncbi:MAG: hypothetical protein KDC98_06185 [Planctomycetes bacterium]|nr:hypothetical protein [Planctomycetota bacterium]